MTGIATGKVLSLNLKKAAKVVLKTNETVAKKIGINKASRTTCVKPEGTASLVVGSSSGIHAWHGDFYIRRIRVGKNEPVYSYLYSHHPEIVEDDFFKPKTEAIISVPQKAPDKSITREESALNLLNRVKTIYKNWIVPGHRSGNNNNNCSTTVTVKPHEWEEVGNWMWKNRNNYTALSILPYDGGTYVQAPFESITQETFEKMFNRLKEIDLSKIVEIYDSTTLKENLACAGNACEI